jgi:hypothetical protein
MKRIILAVTLAALSASTALAGPIVTTQPVVQPKMSSQGANMVFDFATGTWVALTAVAVCAVLCSKQGSTPSTTGTTSTPPGT